MKIAHENAENASKKKTLKPKTKKKANWNQNDQYLHGTMA